MKMIVGLGNPGLDYAKTRHNVGFMVIERLLAAIGGSDPVKSRFHAACVETRLAGEKCLLMRPTTYMNRSGMAVAEGVSFYKLDPAKDVLVVSDEVALPTGMIKIKPGGGTAGHNGLEDITRALGTDQYPRLRVGVGVQPAGGKPAVMIQSDFVLSRFTAEEGDLLASALGSACNAVETFISKGVSAAMNAFNTKNTTSKPPPEKSTEEGRGTS
jgi:peptidyl-tRNA hydrolase, PTH1 family